MQPRFPKANDRFRYMLTRAPVWRLLLYYALLNLVLTAILSGLTHGLVVSGVLAGETGPPGELLVGFLALLVGQDWPASGLTQFDGFAAIQAATGLIAIILPALLLGAVVFRIMAPKSDLLSFDPHLYLKDAKDKSDITGPTSLVSTFLIRTPVRCFGLRAKINLKYFKRHKPGDTGRPERFPWHSIDLGDGFRDRVLALPYDLIPTRFEIDVIVFRERDAFETAIKQSEAATTPKVLIENGGIVHVHVNGRNLRPGIKEDVNYCDLMVTVSGSLPDAQAEIREVHRYDLFRDFRDSGDESENFEVTYLRRTDDYFVSKLKERERGSLWTKLRGLRGRRHF